jgi:hypothetical protein
MELNCTDDVAKHCCKGRKVQLVEFVHEHLGNASVVNVSNVSEKHALKLETADGEIFVNYDITRKLNF